MKLLDNTGSTAKGRDHFLIEINGVSYAYCYIRKNACSAFKNLFIHESACAMNKGSALKNMRFYHSGSKDQVMLTDFRVVILRDPIQRVLSVFQNKFVQQLGASDLFFNYNSITGKDPRVATFNDFIFHYLNNPLRSLDVHLHPQIVHLYPVTYNAACDIINLYEMANIIFGELIADKYFKVKSNKSSDFLPSTTAFADYPAYILNNQYLKTGRVPNFSEIMTREHSEFIREKYSEDINFYQDFLKS